MLPPKCMNIHNSRWAGRSGVLGIFCFHLNTRFVYMLPSYEISYGPRNRKFCANILVTIFWARKKITGVVPSLQRFFPRFCGQSTKWLETKWLEPKCLVQWATAGSEPEPPQKHCKTLLLGYIKPATKVAGRLCGTSGLK